MNHQNILVRIASHARRLVEVGYLGILWCPVFAAIPSASRPDLAISSLASRLIAGLAALTLGTVTAQAQAVDLQSGLKAYWNFDAKNFKDTAGIFDGTGSGSSPITFTPGRAGFAQALQLDGVDQRVEITGGEPDDLAFQGGSMTVAGWFKVGAFDKSWQALVAKGEGSSWRVHRRGGEPGFAYAGGTGEGPAMAEGVNDGNWHHFAAISDLNAVNFGTALYIDGVQATAFVGAPNLAANGKRMMIGDNPDANGRFWNGLVDDIAVWDRPLNEKEVGALYNKGAGASLSSLLGSVLVDTDKDGMPDEFEVSNGFNPNDASDAAKDFDKDGATNAQEYAAGTDPIDVTKPVIVSAASSGDFKTVTLTFSEAVEAVSATTLANYAFSPNLAVTAASVKKNVVTLTTAAQAPGAVAYTVTVNNVVDTSKNAVAANSKSSFYSFMNVKDGVLKFSFWGNIPGTPVDNLYQDPRWPASPDYIKAVFAFNSRDALPSDANDNYGASMEGFLTPTESGRYRFFIYSDDASQFFISSDDKEANLAQVAEETGCCNFFAEPDSARTSEPVALIAGKKYFVRLVYKEGGGLDYGQIAWRKEGDTTGAGKLTPIPGKFLSSAVDLPSDPAGAYTQVSPAANAKGVSPAASVTIVHRDGKTAWTAANVSLKFDGQTVTPTVTKDGNVITIKYTPPALSASLAVHTVSLGYLDAGGKAATYDYSFTTGAYSGPYPVITDPLKTTIGFFTGGDPGEGLDLKGNFVYALSIGADADFVSDKIQDVQFLGLLDSEVPGATLSAQNRIKNWYVVNYGDSANDDALEAATSSIRWSGSPNFVTLTLDNLQIGTEYKFQMMFGEQCCNRGFDIFFDDALVVKDFNPGVAHERVAQGEKEALVTYTYTPKSSTVVMRFDGSEASADYSDHNAILNAVTVEKLGLALDTDKDGMPDDYEKSNGFNPNDPADAKADPDADGFDNVTEYNAGTDPKDMTPPSLLGASASASGTTFTVTFSEKVDRVTASNVANYSISPFLIVTAAAVKGNTVTLTTAKQNLNGTEYSISVSNVQDLSKKTIVAASKVSAYSFIILRNGIAKFSAWLGIGGGLQNLYDDPRYQAGTPDVVGAMFGMNSRDVFPTDANDNYGATMEAILTPTDSGNYRFFIYTDDTSQLFLSTDDKPANLAQIAEETGCCNYFTEPGSPRTSEPIALTAGKKYFIRLVYKEGGGGDYGQVAWRKEGDATPASALKPIDGKFLSAEAVASPAGFIKSVAPTPKTFQAGNNMEIVHVDGRTVQTAATTSLEVDGVKVNADIQKSGIYLTVKYTASFAPNTKHSARLNYLDIAGKPTSYEWSFSTNPLNNANALFIEAEDFDFDGGQTITDQKIGMTGKYVGGAFEGKGGIAGVDFNNPGGNAGQPYRTDTAVAAGKGPNGGGRNRGLFDVDVNYTVGWNDVGDWQNYTRTFPTPAKKYSVYGFASSGGSPIHLTLDQVTAGVGTDTQTLKPLAELKPGRATAGWDSLEILPFTDPVTKSPSVLELGGKMTLRLTLPAGNCDIDFLAFVPIDDSSSGGNDASLVQIQSVTPSGSDVVVPVIVNGFNIIETVQFTIGWDPSVLEYRGVSKFGLNGMTESSFAANSQSGRTNKLSFSWDDSTLAGVTLTNGSALFNLNFKVVGNATGAANIVFENQPTGLEVSSQGKVIPTRSVNGIVTIVSSLAGTVEYYASVGGKVAGVKVELSNGSTGVTDAAGAFLVNYQPGVNYTLTPSYATDSPIANGVTTADITLIRRHVLGLAILDSPYKILAGDVNGSDSVTTADITLIRRLILGISTTFNSGLWRFVPSDETFVDMTKPWTAKRMRQYVSLASGKLTGQDFKAIKLGDVNGSWKAPTVTTGSITKSKSKGRLTVGKVRAEAGKTVNIPVSLAGVNQLGSLQLTLSWDANAASYEGVEGLSLGGLSLENLGLARVSEGVLSVSWDHPSGRVIDLTGTAGLFQLKLRPKATTAKRIEIRVTEGPTRLELTDGDTEVMAAVDPGWLEIGAPGEVGADLVSLRFVGLNSDGRMELEARGPEGMKLNLEASDTLKTWAEVQSVTGQGTGTPVKVTLQPDPNVQTKFWRVRVR